MTEPTVLDRAAENIHEIQQVISVLAEADIDPLVEAIDAHPRVVFHASGRSLLMLKAVAMRLMHTGLDVRVAGEVVTPALRSGDLLVVASARLGAAARGAIDRAHAVAADAYVITTDRGPASPLVGSAVLELPVRTRIDTVQHAGSLFEQVVLVVGDAVCRSVQERRGIPTSDLDARHANL